LISKSVTEAHAKLVTERLAAVKLQQSIRHNNNTKCVDKTKQFATQWSTVDQSVFSWKCPKLSVSTAVSYTSLITN